jgi:hypothetical protein
MDKSHAAQVTNSVAIMDGYARSFLAAVLDDPQAALEVAHRIGMKRQPENTAMVLGPVIRFL